MNDDFIGGKILRESPAGGELELRVGAGELPDPVRHFYGAASDGEQGATEADIPYFTGRVLETNEKGFLLEVTDTGNGAFAVGDKVQVNVDRSQYPDYGSEDLLRISFDGKVALSYPPQVTSVISIQMAKS